MGKKKRSEAECEAVMWLVWKKAAYSQTKHNVSLDEFQKAFPYAHKRILESKLMSVSYYEGQTVVFGSRRCRDLARQWLYEGKDESNTPMSLIWRSRLRPLFGVGDDKDCANQ